MERASFQGWIDSYERAWRTPGTAILAELFTEDATYRTAPFERPYEGLEAIAEFWDAEREGPDEEFAMSSEILAAEGDAAVARVDVRYRDPERRYLDLWVIRLNSHGRCREFEEWPFWPPGSGGSYVPGPAGG